MRLCGAIVCTFFNKFVRTTYWALTFASSTTDVDLGESFIILRKIELWCRKLVWLGRIGLGFASSTTDVAFARALLFLRRLNCGAGS
ncbi:hypothetical protein CEXT_565271 [Caerostris extrusa]|uniref:Secreted protein n=1 Tax=Caerostris extrusa TaxID=172846 RepID=A0AAV4TPX0_CAEEX|nr:hypothetical protein CEXT_565271 [Caerostris extrusa]